MSTERIDKGRALEQAVKFIQKTILESSPELQGTSFTVETNVRDKSSGVLHEIDVLVKTHLKTDYEAIWIFECKNWSKPVDKNEVIVLAEKVDALSANKGYLVAKTITSGAEAQLKKNKRLAFIHCSDDFLTPFFSLSLTHTVADLLPLTVQIKYRGPSMPPPGFPSTNEMEMDCQVDRRPDNFTSYVQDHIDELIRKDMKDNVTKYNHSGTHLGQVFIDMCFAEHELKIGGIGVEVVTMPIRFFVKTSRKKILSQFELEGQGRSYSFEPIEDFMGNKKVEIHVVQKI